MMPFCVQLVVSIGECLLACPLCRSVLKDVVKTHSLSVAIETTYEDFHDALQAKGSKQIADIKEPMR